MDLFRTAWRILFFSFSEDDLASFGRGHLLLGLSLTWLVGIGRYWDNPRAGFLQHLGVGSVVYVFVLSLWLFLVIWPLKPDRFSYRHLLTFVSLTSPPAILYAIPIEQMTDFGRASSVNLLILCIVATWRVVLLGLYLARWFRLRGYVLACATLLPLALIVVALAWLNLDRAVFEIMAGIDRTRTVDDAVYGSLILFSTLVTFSSPILLGLYAVAIWKRLSGGAPARDAEE